MPKFARLGRIFPLFATLTFSRPALCPAQDYSTENFLQQKALYEKTLEEKLDSILIKILGFNQAKVAVNAEIDFSKTEQIEVNPGDKSAAEEFRWRKNVSPQDYLMPGFPVLPDTETKSLSKKFVFPSAFVKRLEVTVLLSKNISDENAQSIRRVISDVMMLDARRGDSLTIVKAPFAPLWKTIWHRPESMSILMKYFVLTLMGIVAMAVVAVGFLKLANAMSTMAKVQQSHQITMDFAKGAGAQGAGEEEAEIPSLSLPGGEALKRDETGQEKETDEVIFEIKPGHVPFLVNMMLREHPANVAIVASHLSPETKREFLKSLPPDFASEVIVNMAKLRFMEPEIILNLKEKLEKRMEGAVGGISQTLDVFESLSLPAKAEMLGELRKNHPDVAAQIRKSVLLPEDLAALSGKDISALFSSVKTEKWASAMWEIPEELKNKIKAQIANKTWQMIEQSMGYGSPSREAINKAMEEIMETAAALIKEGKISNPLESETAEAIATRENA